MKNSIREKLLDSSASHFIAFMSIIQGAVVAYAIVLLDFNTIDFSSPDFKLHRVFTLLSSITMFILVWDEYHTSAFLYRWIARMRDTVIPFIIGTLEMLLVKACFDDAHPYRWYTVAAVLTAVAIYAYRNMYERARNSADIVPKNAAIIELLNKSMPYRSVQLSVTTLQTIYLLVSTVLFTTLAAFISNDNTIANTFSILAFVMIQLYAWLCRKIKAIITEYARSG